MISRVFSLSIVFSLCVPLAVAAASTELKYNNHPIEALCFSDIENNAKTLDLKKCDLAKQKYKVKGQNTKLIAKGYTGYDWQNPDFPNSGGYSYYKVFEAGKGQYWIYAINNGGGSGEFSTILLAKRKDVDTLEIEILSGGDRCNGGLQNVSEVNNQLSFSVNLTAYDLVNLSKKSLPNIKAYDGLAACAVCCVAKAFYKVTSSVSAQLKYIDIESSMNVTELPAQGTYQACFNKLFTSWIAAGKSQLKQAQLDEFVDEFNKTCVKAGS